MQKLSGGTAQLHPKPLRFAFKELELRCDGMDVAEILENCGLILRSVSIAILAVADPIRG